MRTDPGQAADFVAATGVDALAVTVGSSHAMSRTHRRRRCDLMAALRDAVGVPLVLHGSSGLPDAQLATAVAACITKVNIAHHFNVAFSTTIRDRLADGTVVDPRRYLAHARNAITGAVAHLLSVPAVRTGS